MDYTKLQSKMQTEIFWYQQLPLEKRPCCLSGCRYLFVHISAIYITGVGPDTWMNNSIFSYSGQSSSNNRHPLEKRSCCSSDSRYLFAHTSTIYIMGIGANKWINSRIFCHSGKSSSNNINIKIENWTNMNFWIFFRQHNHYFFPQHQQMWRPIISNSMFLEY